MRAKVPPMRRAYKMLDEACELFRVLEAPLTHVQPLHFATDELLWVEGRVPRLDQQRAEDDLNHIGCR